MKIPYEERQLGVFYYCRGISTEYIFQCNDLDGNRFPTITKSSGGVWGRINTDSSFRNDWERGKDDELRLATFEEIKRLIEADTRGLLIPSPTEEYSIY